MAHHGVRDDAGVAAFCTRAGRRGSTGTTPKGHFPRERGQTRLTTFRPTTRMLGPKSMTTPPTAASTDATGIIVSGPKYAKSIRILEIRRPVRSSNPSSAPSRIEVHADGRPRLSISRVRVYGCA